MSDRAAKLRAMVKAARHEADQAVTYREAWRPMAHDAQLHERLGKSFASQTFLVIRLALWRETLAALMRIWDRKSDAIHLSWMIAQLQDEKLISELREKQFASLSPEIAEAMLEDIISKAAKVKAVFDEYDTGAKRRDHTFLQQVRHEQLAHARTKSKLTEAPANWCDQRTEDFYKATMFIVGQLLSLVEATYYDLADTAEVYGHHAKLFWAGVKGERTEGHPNYIGMRPLT